MHKQSHQHGPLGSQVDNGTTQRERRQALRWLASLGDAGAFPPKASAQMRRPTNALARTTATHQMCCDKVA